MVHLIPVGGRGEEMLAPRLDPLDGAAEPARHRGHEYVFRVHVPLDAEASADLGGDDSHMLFRHAENGRDARPHSEGHLGGEPDGEETGCSVVGGEHPAPFDGHARHPRVGEVHLHDEVGLGEGGLRIARS